jgi:penicillin-binding protein 2
LKEQALRRLELRFRFFFILIILVFIVLLARLWYLQIVQGEEYYAASLGNFGRQIRIAAPRGNIYDRNGNLLVSNRFSHVVSVVPNDFLKNPEALRFLSDLLEIPETELVARFEKLKSSQREQYVPVKHDVSPEVIGRILEARLDFPGVTVEQYPVRSYPLGEVAAHLFGHISEINQEELAQMRGLGYRLGDLVGKMGLEKTYETYLRGTDGLRILQVDSVGQHLQVLDEIGFAPGQNLHLTLDLELQLEAEKALSEHLVWLRENTEYTAASAGVVVVMDPRSGAILAMVSYPRFDPNIFVGGASQEVLGGLLNDPLRPFTNRVTREGYMPGSTFKPVTVIAALEEGVTGPNQSFVCKGMDRIHGALFRCWKQEGHGVLNLVEGLAHSCNMVLAELAREVGPEGIAKYARLLGFGAPTGLELHPLELSGLIGDPDYKRKTRDPRWYPIETVHLSVGQGFIQVTPIQLVQAFAVIANGGKHYQPWVVQRIETADGRVIKEFSPQITREIQLKPTTWELVREGLEKTVSTGTARGAFWGFPLDRIPVAGKTGTAQIYGKEDYAFFASYAPADNPELVILVAVEEGGSGSLGAAPVARRLYEVYFGLRKPAASSRQQPAKEAKTPAEKTPAEKTPAEKTPAEKTPVEKTPVEKAPAPAEKKPVVKETPAETAPAEKVQVERVPVEKNPEEKAPVEKAPVEEAPQEQTLVEEAPGQETPVGEAPLNEVPEEGPLGEEGVPVEEPPDAPVQEVTGEEAPVDENPVG